MDPYFDLVRGGRVLATFRAPSLVAATLTAIRELPGAHATPHGETAMEPDPLELDAQIAIAKKIAQLEQRTTGGTTHDDDARTDQTPERTDDVRDRD